MGSWAKAFITEVKNLTIKFDWILNKYTIFVTETLKTLFMTKRILALFVAVTLLSSTAFSTNSVKNLLPGNGKELQISTLTAKTLTKMEARAIQKAEKKQVRTQKRVALVQKMLAKNMAKKAVDFKDPVNKWLWYAVFAWGASIVLWILAAALITGTGFLGGGILGLLASLVALFGTVAFVIWLVKKFGDA